MYGDVFFIILFSLIWLMQITVQQNCIGHKTKRLQRKMCNTHVLFKLNNYKVTNNFLSRLSLAVLSTVYSIFDRFLFAFKPRFLICSVYIWYTWNFCTLQIIMKYISWIKTNICLHNVTNTLTSYSRYAWNFINWSNRHCK